MLYSGIHRNWDFNYINPFSFWVIDSMNSFSGDGNGFLYGGILFKNNFDWDIWSEILIDDYMINYDSEEHLEPNTIGITIGFEIKNCLILHQ